MDALSIKNVAAVLGVPAVDPAAAQPAGVQERSLIQAVKALDAAELFGQDKELTFVMDRQTRRAVVRIVDRSTGEVLQQIPTEQVLRLAEQARTGSARASFATNA